MANDRQDWVDQMWYAGYCHDTVALASTTELETPEGSERRVAWLREHVPQCRDCAYANMFKGIEASIAEELGFIDEFRKGANVSQQPGFSAAHDRHMKRALRLGLVDDDVEEWMVRATKRNGSPWPGTTD